MRPLTRTTLTRENIDTKPALGLLINAFGPYCAISEEPVFDVTAVWDYDTNRLMAPDLPLDGKWETALLLAPATASALLRDADTATREPMTPDVDLTFRLEDSPFSYELEQVQMVYLDENGQPDGPGECEPLVIVRAANQRAQSTLDLFALNTRYFDPRTNELRIPRIAYLTREDHRLFNRTAAWQRAAEVAELIASIPATHLPPILEQTRLLVAATGFWSVWATILWKRFEDRSMLARVLAEPEENREHLRALHVSAGIPELSELPGPGPHNSFPGTRMDWLG